MREQKTYEQEEGLQKSGKERKHLGIKLLGGVGSAEVTGIFDAYKAAVGNGIGDQAAVVVPNHILFSDNNKGGNTEMMQRIGRDMRVMNHQSKNFRFLSL